MDVQDYCNGLEAEMTAWKAKLYDVMRKVDKLGSAEKEKALPNIEDGTVDMRGKYEETMDYIGKSSPVSIPG